MSSIAEYFEKNKYVYLTNVVNAKTSEDLAQHMFDLHKLGKLEKDPQCPLSDSIYGDPIFDKLLSDLTAPLSKQLGVELDPAYTYARIYRPGEALERHIDRPSCEISGTMTLGFDPNTSVWPIYFAEDKDDLIGSSINIGVGDLLMYRGGELSHWRPPFKGIWQVQIFFHYVDKNGEHKEYKFDKREKLGVDKVTGESKNVVFKKSNGYLIPKHDNCSPYVTTFDSSLHSELTFSQEECEKIIAFGKTQYSQKAAVGDKEKGRVDTSIRSVNRFEISLDDTDKEWIFNKIANAVGKANLEYFKYDLLGITHDIELLQYTREDNGHYDWHLDVGNGGACTRKISISIPLSERTSYDGGNLELNNGNIFKCRDEQGSITMFSSYALHRVSPVTLGERWVMVIWIHGSDRFN